MVGKIAAEECSADFELLRAPHSLRAQSVCSCLPLSIDSVGSHNHGAGVAWLDAGTIKLEKTGEEDCWSEEFQRTVEQITTQAFIAHNRFASPGLSIDRDLAHPYSTTVNGDVVAFCHNGGVRQFMDEARVQGVTDSMIFLDQLSSQLSQLSVDQMRNFLARCADDWRYTSLNGMLLTKETVYAWRCFDTNPDTLPIFERYYTLFLNQQSGGACISSEPVDSSRGWSLVPNRILLAIENKNGSVVTRSIEF